jgi:hypothetical protein
VWSFFVVTGQPVVDDFTDLVERFKYPTIQDFVAVRAVEPFDEGVLIQFAGLDIPQGNTFLRAPLGKVQSSKFWPVVETDCFRQVAPSFKLFQGSNYPNARRLVSISMAKASRTPSSRTLKVLKRRP